MNTSAAKECNDHHVLTTRTLKPPYDAESFPERYDLVGVEFPLMVYKEGAVFHVTELPSGEMFIVEGYTVKNELKAREVSYGDWIRED